ncbi:MAG TPA: ImmA/IrrE family metallo-endopeptidase [Iamia sp.]|nr:ImmA/IrrE family metallo-endopeptidase [Iamia sp.]
MILPSRRPMSSPNATGLEAFVVESTMAYDLDDWMDTLARDLVGTAPELPVDVFALAGSLGCEVSRDPTLPSSGRCRPIRGSNLFEISVRTSSPRIERLVVAHELSHALLHRLSSGRFSAGPEVEDCCDALAIRLLVPTSVLMYHLQQLGPTLPTLRRLSDVFSVPLDSLVGRVKELLAVLTIVNEDHRAGVHLSGYIEDPGFASMVQELLVEVRPRRIVERELPFVRGGLDRWHVGLVEGDPLAAADSSVIGIVVPALMASGIPTEEGGSGDVVVRTCHHVTQKYVDRLKGMPYEFEIAELRPES